MRNFSIEFRNESGIFPIKGWCINEDDNCIVLNEKYLFVALIKYLMKRKLYRKDK